MTVSIQLHQKLSSTALGPAHTLKLNNSKFIRQRNQDNGPLEYILIGFEDVFLLKGMIY